MPGWRRTYWAVWTANLITAIGMMSFLPFFPAHLEGLGLEDRAAVATWAGVLYGAAPLSAALMSPLWGSLGDRYGRRLMVLRAMLAIALFVGLMAFARTPLELLLLRLLQGTFSGFVAPSITLVSVAAPPERQGRVSGSLQTAMAAGAIAGPALGGLLATTFGLRQVFLFVAAASVASALLVLVFAREPERAPRAAEEGGAAGLAAALGRDVLVVLQSRELRAAIAVVFAIQLGLGATNPLLERHVRDLVGPGEAAVAATGALFSAMALVNLPAMPLWGRWGDRVGHRAALGRSALGSALGLALHALAPSYGFLLGARLLLGASMAGSMPCAYGLAAAEIESARRGSAIGAVFSARTLAIAVSAMLGGWLSRFVGVRGLFVVGALLVLGACLLLARSAARGPLSSGAPGDAARSGGGAP
jgi:DHA1 family multidrug resistance protein-like MFS transporter